MKCLVLFFFISVVYSHPAIFFDGNEVNNTFDITKIGPETLNCYTHLDTCCSRFEGFHRGDWYFPDGSRLRFISSSNHMYESRSDRVVRMHRRGNNVEEGEYCCKIETDTVHRNQSSDPYIGEKVCITLLNYSKECLAWDAPENGQVTIDGDTATFSCNGGYGLVGEKTLSCFAGEWSGDPPVCEDICTGGKVWDNCGSACPSTCKTYGDPCILLCKPGCVCPPWMVDNNGTCIRPSECSDWCEDPSSIYNGTFWVTGHSLGDNVTYTCDEGFEPWGESMGTCQKDHTWSVQARCIPICQGGKKWNDCGSACPATCFNHGLPIPCTRQCVAECQCPDGLVEHDGVCLNHTKCPVWCSDPSIRNGTFEVTGAVNGTVTFACDDDFKIEGETVGICQEDHEWSIRPPRCIGCVDKLYVMAFTSTVSGGGSNDHHSLFISYKEGNATKNMTIEFFNRQGDDMFSNKGDLWAFDLSSYNLPCLDYHDVKKVAIVQSSYDNWHIESVATVLSINTPRGVRYAMLTLDMEANRWIDNRDGYRRFDLSRYRPFHHGDPPPPPPMRG